MIASSVLIGFMCWQHSKPKPYIFTIIGVKDKCECVTTLDNIESFDYVRIYYTLLNQTYCLISKTKWYILPMSIKTKNKVIRATLHTGDYRIDVTEKIQQIAGPQCNFHDEPIDFAWVFPHFNGDIDIEFIDGSYNVSIPSNICINENNAYIPLYINDCDLIES